MDAASFRKFGHQMVDFIADYLETGAHEPPALSTVSPGYLRPLIPAAAPEEPEDFAAVFADINRVIMPGITHWQSKKFLAYFPAMTSYESVLGDMLSSAVNPIGFAWATSPACTELEVVMMDWLCLALGLPAHFLSYSTVQGAPHGGGVIQGTASEATFVTMLAARHRALQAARDPTAALRLVAYASTQAHMSVEKAAKLAGVHMRLVAADPVTHALQGAALAAAMAADAAAGLLPFYAVATLGTTSLCAFDDVPSIAAACKAYGAWLHVDAAYAGAFMLCPEYRGLFEGLDLVDSFDFNPHKQLRVAFDCSALWLRNPAELTWAMDAHAEYLPAPAAAPHASAPTPPASSAPLGPQAAQPDGASVAAPPPPPPPPDYRHWQVPLGRRFRALKLWFVLRGHGLARLRAHMRAQCAACAVLAGRVRADPRCVVEGARLGLLAFRAAAGDGATQAVEAGLTAAGYHVSHSTVHGRYFVRISFAQMTEAGDVEELWDVIRGLLPAS